MGGGMPRRNAKPRPTWSPINFTLVRTEGKIPAIVSEGQEEMRPIAEQIGPGTQRDHHGDYSGQERDEINKLMAQFTALMAQRGGVEAKAYGKLYAMLDPKQQAKAGAVFAAEMDGMFDSRGGRGRQR